MTTNYFGGVDPGWTGGIVILGADGGIVACSAGFDSEESFLESDAIQFLFNIHDDFNKAHVAVERVGANPVFGSKSSFSFGRSVGALIVALSVSEASWSYVSVVEWQKRMLIGTSKSLSTKKRARLVASRLWPRWDKLRHAGAVDAALIAEYLRRREQRLQ